MNKVILIGRLTRDPETRYTTGENATAVSKFALAVNRRTNKKSEGQSEADYINCTAFGRIAETIAKYAHKGSKIAIVGRIQTGSYTNKDNVKVYTTDVIVEELELLDNKPKEAQDNSPEIPASNEFMDIPDGIDAELPFN